LTFFGQENFDILTLMVRMVRRKERGMKENYEN
jgi:hypothetical protein